MKKLRYLLWFANENVDFRLPELLSIISLFRIDVDWIHKPNLDPFWVVELKSEEDALKIASRSVTLRSILKLWGSGTTLDELHTSVKLYPQELMAPYLKLDLSFRVQVETFCKTYTMKEKVDKIEMFNYLPVNGPVKLNNPDVSLHYIEYFGLDPNNIPPEPYHFYFGMWVCDGQRDLISKYSLKKRIFIGNTSMDAQLSLIMSNQAQVQAGDLVMDPFVGTGSLLVACACFGAYVIGTDIDYLMLHGKTRPTRKQNREKPRASDESVYSNMKQYGTEHQYIDVVVGDSSLPIWYHKLQLDAILTDPPYGIREATERVGSVRDYKVSDEHLSSHIPSKVGYGLDQIYRDLLAFAAKHLKLNGRLVSWIPVHKAEYCEDRLPYHCCLQLIANSEQDLTIQTSRRLLTWKKIAEPEMEPQVREVPQVNEMFPKGFRDQCFGNKETRKQRRARIGQELKDRGIEYQPRRKNSER